MLVCEVEIVVACILAELRRNRSVVIEGSTMNGLSGGEQGNIDLLSGGEYSFRYGYVETILYIDALRILRHRPRFDSSEEGTVPYPQFSTDFALILYR